MQTLLMEKEELNAALSIEENAPPESTDCKEVSDLSSVLQKEVEEKVDNLILDESPGLFFISSKLCIIYEAPTSVCILEMWETYGMSNYCS